jgi:hypothetical protein
MQCDDYVSIMDDDWGFSPAASNWQPHVVPPAAAAQGNENVPGPRNRKRSRDDGEHPLGSKRLKSPGVGLGGPCAQPGPAGGSFTELQYAQLQQWSHHARPSAQPSGPVPPPTTPAVPAAFHAPHGAY